MPDLPYNATCWPWPRRPWRSSLARIEPLDWQYRCGANCAWCAAPATLLVVRNSLFDPLPACADTICIDHLARIENHHRWKNSARLKKRKAANIHRWGYTRGFWPKERT